MKIYTCLCLLFLAGYLVAQNNTSALLPMPNQITPVKGKPFTVRSGKTAIYLNQPELQFTAKTLQTILQERFHLHPNPAVRTSVCWLILQWKEKSIIVSK